MQEPTPNRGDTQYPYHSANIALFIVSYAHCGRKTALVTQTLAGTGAAGTWTGIQNTIGSLSGVVAPVATGFIITRTGSYFWAFASPAILAVAGAGCYVFLVGKVAPVQWRGH